jgi:hypothetical protein
MKRLLLLLTALLIGPVAANAQPAIGPVYPLQIRTLITYPTTFYVSPTGSDSNPCTSDAPCATVQAVYNSLVTSFDLGGQTITIQFADGTYTNGVNSTIAPTGGGSIIFQGNASSNTAVLFQCDGDCWHFSFNSAVALQFVNLSTTAGAASNEYYFYGAINATMTGIYLKGGGIFGVYAENRATVVFDTTNWNFDRTWTGTDSSVLGAYFGGTIVVNASTVTTNVGATYTNFVIAYAGTIRSAGVTFTLAAGAYTGKRSSTTINGLNAGNGCGTYWPGSIAGTATAGGQCFT